MSGKLARYDEYEETRADFSRWKGIYETWQRRKPAYHQSGRVGHRFIVAHLNLVGQ